MVHMKHLKVVLQVKVYYNLIYGIKKPQYYSEVEWDYLKEDIINNGLRNSLLVAPMPTASTAQIMGNNESFEPYTSNIYTRRVLAGEFVLVNKHLVKILKITKFIY